MNPRRPRAHGPVVAATRRLLSRSALMAVAFLTSAGAGADLLSALPPPWNSLQSVGQYDVSWEEPTVQASIAAARNDIDELLGLPSTPQPRLAEAYGRLGALYQLYRVSAGAERCYANARRLQPDAFRWVYYLGYLALATGRIDDAERLFREAGALAQDYPTLELRMGQVWLDQNETVRARTALEAAAGREGQRAAALYYLGQLALLERDHPAAVARFEEALALAPDADGIHYPLAQALRASGNAEQARRHLALAGKRLPAPEDPLVQELEALRQGARQFYLQAMRTTERGEYAEAARAFGRGLELDPENVNARISYARTLVLAGDQDRAQQEIQAVLARSPGHGLAHFLLGALLEDGGDLTEAAASYRRALEADPELTGAHYYLANLLFREARPVPAGRHYARVIERDADIPPAHVYHLVTRRGEGVSDPVLRSELERLVGSFPDDLLLRYALVRLLAASPVEEIRDPGRALEMARELASRMPIAPHIASVALATASNGDHERAVFIQQRLVEDAPWMGVPASEQDWLARELESYRRGELPQPAWSVDDPLMTPPPVDVRAVFREYPQAVPF